MKGLFIILTFVFTTVSYSQTNLKKEIEKLPKNYHRGCDTIAHKKIEGIVLGELMIKIEIDSAYHMNNKLKIIGEVKTKDSDEPIQYCYIWKATFDTVHCELNNLLAITDQKGNFTIEFENKKETSLYFWSISYIGLEIKIGKLMN